MINVGMYYEVNDGHESEFEAMFSDVTEKLKNSGSGIKNAQLYKAVGKSEYLIYTEWESKDAFKAFIQSKAFRDTTSKGNEIIKGRPRHRIFAEINE